MTNNIAIAINDQIDAVMRGRQNERSKRISAMGREFYREGGHDEVLWGEMIYSCMMIIDAE